MTKGLGSLQTTSGLQAWRPSGSGRGQEGPAAPGRAPLPEEGKGSQQRAAGGGGPAPARPGRRKGLPGAEPEGRGSTEPGLDRWSTPARRRWAPLSSWPGPGGRWRGGELRTRTRTRPEAPDPGRAARRDPHLREKLSSGYRGRTAARTHWATAAIAPSCPPTASARPSGPPRDRRQSASGQAKSDAADDRSARRMHASGQTGEAGGWSLQLFRGVAVRSGEELSPRLRLVAEGDARAGVAAREAREGRCSRRGGEPFCVVRERARPGLLGCSLPVCWGARCPSTGC